jgi:hypothetical protein
MTFKAGGFLENMISAIWPKFQHWNHLPASANITSAGILSVVIYWGVQTYVSMLPIKLAFPLCFEINQMLNVDAESFDVRIPTRTNVSAVNNV